MKILLAQSPRLAANGAGAALGPALAGALMGAAGPGALFMMLGTLTGALTLYGLWRKTRRGPPAAKRPFVTRSLPEAAGGGPAQPG